MSPKRSTPTEYIVLTADVEPFTKTHVSIFIFNKPFWMESETNNISNRSAVPFTNDWMLDAKECLKTAGSVSQRMSRLEKALMNRIEEMDMNKNVSDRKTQQVVDLMNQLVAESTKSINR